MWVLQCGHPNPSSYSKAAGILRNTESCQGVICEKFDADFFYEMKGKMRNESYGMSLK